MPETSGGRMEKKVAAILRRIDPSKPYEKELFNAIARVSVSVAVEAVCLRKNRETGEIEVFLTERRQGDAYAGEWHCPGSVLRPGEELSDVFERLEKKEFRGKIARRRFIDHFNNPEERRGHFFNLIFLCETDGTSGKWHPVNALPKNTVKHHKDHIIPRAVRAFQKA